jgi:hypothetical protein
MTNLELFLLYEVLDLSYSVERQKGSKVIFVPWYQYKRLKSVQVLGDDNRSFFALPPRWLGRQIA